MSVHDDGPPRWKKEDVKVEAPPPSGAPTPAASAPDEKPFIHADAVATHADALLKSYVEQHVTITSLDFKHALRRRCVELEPTPVISQDDVSKYLKRWFLDRGEKDGYAFREHPALDEKGEPKPGRTVYNEYFYAPGAREEEKKLEAKFEKAAKSGDEKVRAGFLEWVRKTFTRGGK